MPLSNGVPLETDPEPRQACCAPEAAVEDDAGTTSGTVGMAVSRPGPQDKDPTLILNMKGLD